MPFLSCLPITPRSRSAVVPMISFSHFSLVSSSRASHSSPAPCFPISFGKACGVCTNINTFKLVITKGQGVRATTIEGPTAFAPMLCFASVSRDRWSKHARSNYGGQKVETLVIKLRSVYSIHSQWKFKRMLATYMRRMRNNNLEIRIADSLVALPCYLRQVRRLAPLKH